ncbi:FAD-binding domain-containing protein [Aspergillus uvarum CBS 121591]|uniref:FAD-binding domain-containing protein n=1 Tax=Aspergillus uvarum CBS 121591 TaxID=1448315 RepID=A0A319BUW4_9EURO|nr:FAD-binding domain-containing protein [Aspergillus uvarum CBS 121591]PYH77476.1 FAD-binding domain-containing protein [Aspergillus uvarum CBS 121591]
MRTDSNASSITGIWNNGSTTSPRGVLYNGSEPLAWALSSVERNQPQLSNRTHLDTRVVPDSPLWPNATSRYQTYEPPQIKVVVQVGCEEDVATVLAFLQGQPRPRHDKYSGLVSRTEIDMQLLTGIEINANGDSARFQGGTFTQEVMGVLWKQGYVATTESCGCVGMVGLGLGGGHGRLQGRYRLVSDKYLGLNVVLANGTVITVSETSHPNFFLGMKRAGHNFSVVTSFELRIFPRQEETWY